MIEPYSWFSRTIHHTWWTATGGGVGRGLGLAVGRGLGAGVGWTTGPVGRAVGRGSIDAGKPGEPSTTPIPGLNDGPMEGPGPPDVRSPSHELATTRTTSDPIAIRAIPDLR